MRILFIILIAMGFTSLNAQNVTYKNLLGKWEGPDEKNQMGSIQFIDSSNLIMSFSGSPEIKMNYKIDFSRNPAWMDVSSVTGRARVVKSLIQLINQDTLKWEVFPDGQRSSDFTKGAITTVIVLKKVQ
jgi:hypothetical protein